MASSYKNQQLSFAFIIGIVLAQVCGAAVVKFSDAPLSQVVELYSKETGKNVFVDEGVQQQRKVTAHLKDMKMDKAFDIVQKTIGLESTTVGTNTVLLYPPEKSQRYAEPKAFVLKTPAGVDTKWLLGTLNGLFPNVRTSISQDPKSIVLYGTETEIKKVKELSRTLPKILTQQGFLPMSESQAKDIQKELAIDEALVEPSPIGLTIQGSPSSVRKTHAEIRKWQKRTNWGKTVFTPLYLDSQKIMKAAEAAKGRTGVSDLGGTGSILIEGPKADREELLAILSRLDIQSRRRRKAMILGEIKPDAAKEAMKGFGVEPFGDRKMVLVGRNSDVEDAASLLDSLGQKKQQVLIQFRLAEITKTRLKTLGIDLNKNSYSYDEIKSYHPNDTLPLLLRALNEGNNGRILAEPNIQVIEGEEARVTIGDRIPLEVAATAQTDAGSTLKLNTQLTWVDVGIKMTIRNVAVNPDGSIRMGLKGEVSSVISTTKQGYPQIRTREAESMLRVNNGGYVIMGGLINQEDRKNRHSIPLIGGIPLFGELAQSRDRQKTATEIIMIVTARITEE